ncbi:hypothetical protein Sjap_020516 [Stephania japonica]|uniref:Amine oxidase n=1 Tax=Stephania japonica TaxID=461633 RepID=A0AAP0F6D4_9MAGN
MEARTLRLSFLLVTALLLLLFTRSWIHLPYNTPSENRFQSNIPNIKNPPKGPKPNSIDDHNARTPLHPLDPLTVQEINRARSILYSYPPFSSSPPNSFTIHSLVLQEPHKQLVLKWKTGDPLFPRRASLIAILNRQSHIMTLDLGSESVIRHEISSSSGFPTMTNEEMNYVTSVPLTDPKFNRTVRSRGVDLTDLACLPISGGWFGVKEEENTRRLIRVQCYSLQGTSNFYMRPIEGLTVTVDLDTKQVVEVSDRGRGIPIPAAANTEYVYNQNTHMTKSSNSPRINPISIEQVKGPSFEIENGHMVKWANWEFHLKADPRAGVIISRAMARDFAGSVAMRSVLYKGMTSELFVPYMDPTEAWYFKTYMDAGEYGFGLQAMPLEPLNDCPRNARFVDGVFAAADGKPYVRENMICVFESYGGEIGWRHSESPITGMGIREVRPKVTLVVRMAASVANYDYIVDWEFQMDGIIRVKVGLSGILMVKGTPYDHMNKVPEQEELYGTLLSENVIGVIHDHFVTFYLDMDIDGLDNSFVKVNLERQQNSGSETPRRSYLKANRRIAKTEKEAQIQFKLYEPAEYHVVNPSKLTRVGNPVGYKVVPRATAASLLDHDDPPQRRGAFTNNQIYVTPYNESEQWAGGLFVYQSHGEDTLAVWSERDRDIENKDIVLWYTLGFHHVPCQEDFPIMPVVSSSFDLKPVNFFERNPILSVPPNFEKDLPVCKADASA